MGSLSTSPLPGVAEVREMTPAPNPGMTSPRGCATPLRAHRASEAVVRRPQQAPSGCLLNLMVSHLEATHWGSAVLGGAGCRGSERHRGSQHTPAVRLLH